MAKSSDITFYQDATAKCTNCGSVYTLGSTIQTLSIEICGNCHPFYTGKETLVDTAGRIDKFNARSEKIVTTDKVAKAKVRKNVQSLGDLMEETQPEEKAPKADKPAKVAKSEVSSDVNSETVKTVAANESPKAETTPSTSSSSIADDLTKIEGVGPKAAEEFIKAGITTFAQLATTDIDKMKEILANAESKVQHLDPTTWAEQSQLAADGKWDELKTLQDALMGGVEK